jgi:hypothetical protein
MAEILASLDDVQANLDENVAAPTDENTHLLQISIARIVRGYLAGLVDNVVLQSWRTPDSTPDIIREAAAKLIAAQHYFNEISQTTNIIDPDSYAQKLYDRGMAILNGIIDGQIVVEDIDVTVGGELTALDFFPVDATDRAFTLGMEL